MPAFVIDFLTFLKFGKFEIVKDVMKKSEVKESSKRLICSVMRTLVKKSVFFTKVYILQFENIGSHITGHIICWDQQIQT